MRKFTAAELARLRKIMEGDGKGLSFNTTVALIDELEKARGERDLERAKYLEWRALAERYERERGAERDDGTADYAEERALRARISALIGDAKPTS